MSHHYMHQRVRNMHWWRKRGSDVSLTEACTLNIATASSGECQMSVDTNNEKHRQLALTGSNSNDGARSSLSDACVRCAQSTLARTSIKREAGLQGIRRGLKGAHAMQS